MSTTEAMNVLNTNKKYLTFQEFSTLRGQIRAGNIDAAMKGLQKLMRKKVSA